MVDLAGLEPAFFPVHAGTLSQLELQAHVSANSGVGGNRTHPGCLQGSLAGLGTCDPASTSPQAPPTGFEPVTFWLTTRRSPSELWRRPALLCLLPSAYCLLLCRFTNSAYCAGVSMPWAARVVVTIMIDRPCSSARSCSSFSAFSNGVCGQPANSSRKRRR